MVINLDQKGILTASWPVAVWATPFAYAVTRSHDLKIDSHVARQDRVRVAEYAYHRNAL
jgi:hypothetical protein